MYDKHDTKPNNHMSLMKGLWDQKINQKYGNLNCIQL